MQSRDKNPLTMYSFFKEENLMTLKHCKESAHSLGFFSILL